MGCGVRLARPTVVAILPAYLLYTTVLFGNYVVQQQLLQNQVCSALAEERGCVPSTRRHAANVSGSSDFLTTPCVLNCTKDEDVNGATSVWLGWSDAVLGLVSAITAGAFGSMSDSPRGGRTPVMFLSTVGLLASIGMNVLADVLDLPPLFLVLSNVVNGFTGGYAVFGHGAAR